MSADTMIHDLLVDAQHLEAEKADLAERRGANRDLLRLLKKSGKGTPDERAAIDEFYPEVTRQRNGKTADAVAASAAKK